MMCSEPLYYTIVAVSPPASRAVSTATGADAGSLCAARGNNAASYPHQGSNLSGDLIYTKNPLCTREGARENARPQGGLPELSSVRLGYRLIS
eukprot:6183333-Pleurochrysis_carterae.AAC.3